MKLFSSLGLLAGVFLWLPRSVRGRAVIWAVGKVRPVDGLELPAVYLVSGASK